MFLCFNTSEGLRHRAEEYKGPRFNYGRDKTIEQVAEGLRWSLPDWEYHITNSDEFDKSWSPLQKEIADICIYDDNIDPKTKQIVADRFKRSVCQVLIRLEQSTVFNCLEVTDDFRVFAIEHNESEEEGWARLEAIRKEKKK